MRRLLQASLRWVQNHNDDSREVIKMAAKEKEGGSWIYNMGVVCGSS